MYLETYNSNHILELVDNAKRIAILPSKLGGVDTYSAAAGLFQVLHDKGKDVTVVYQGKFPEGCENLVRAENLKNNVFERTLEVSIDYSEVPTSKMHYEAENNVLKLYMSPVSKDFDISKVKATLTGFQFDLIFTVGVSELHDLGQVYTELKPIIDSSKVVNIDNTKRNKEYGDVAVVDDAISTISGVVFNLFSACRWVPSEKAAKALLLGISANQARF